MRTLGLRVLAVGERLAGILLSIQRHLWQQRFATWSPPRTKDIFSVLGLRILFVVCCHSLNSNLYSDNSARTWWVSRGGCQNSRGRWIKFSKLTQLGIRRVIWVTGGLALQTFNNFWLWMINWELMFDQTQVELHCPFSVLTSTRCTLAIFWGALFAMFAIT